MVLLYHWFLSIALFGFFGSRHSLIVPSGLGTGSTEFMHSVFSCTSAMMHSISSLSSSALQAFCMPTGNLLWWMLYCLVILLLSDVVWAFFDFVFLSRHLHILLEGIPLWLVDCDCYCLPLCWSLSTLLLVVLVCLMLVLLWQQCVLTLLWDMFDWVHSCLMTVLSQHFISFWLYVLVFYLI